jgi:hypothetical protein
MTVRPVGPGLRPPLRHRNPAPRRHWPQACTRIAVGYLTVAAEGEASEPGDVRCGILGNDHPGNELRADVLPRAQVQVVYRGSAKWQPQRRGALPATARARATETGRCGTGPGSTTGARTIPQPSAIYSPTPQAARRQIPDLLAAGKPITSTPHPLPDQAICGLTSQDASSRQLLPALANWHERHSAPRNAPQDDHSRPCSATPLVTPLLGAWSGNRGFGLPEGLA